MTAGRDLVSTIATASNNMPSEPAQPVIRDGEDIHNPELDRAIDELVELYKVKPPESNAVVQFLHPPLSAEAEEAKAEQPIDGEIDGSLEIACPGCAEPSTRRARFCAMCGMPLQRTLAGMSPEHKPEPPATVAESKAEHPTYRTSPYLLAAIVMLLAVISWRWGWDYGLRVGSSRQSTLPPAARAASDGKASVKQQPQAHPATVDDGFARSRGPKVSRAASNGKASVKQQPQADPATDDDEVVWIRRRTDTGK